MDGATWICLLITPPSRIRSKSSSQSLLIPIWRQHHTQFEKHLRCPAILLEKVPPASLSSEDRPRFELRRAVYEAFLCVATRNAVVRMIFMSNVMLQRSR